jgi:hypothetical protein
VTTAAREVLDDCRGALAELVDGVQGPTWRRRWIVAVVLLRAVGHVLEKVDGARSDKHKAEIFRWWTNLKSTEPDPAIFWLFVEEERNTIVKEYQTNAGQGVTVRAPVIELHLSTREQKIHPALPPIYHYTMNAGHYAGRDQRELIAEAIRWWDGELAAIDRALRRNAP